MGEAKTVDWMEKKMQIFEPKAAPQLKGAKAQTTRAEREVKKRRHFNGL